MLRKSLGCHQIHYTELNLEKHYKQYLAKALPPLSEDLNIENRGGLFSLWKFISQSALTPIQSLLVFEVKPQNISC